MKEIYYVTVEVRVHAGSEEEAIDMVQNGDGDAMVLHVYTEKELEGGHDA